METNLDVNGPPLPLSCLRLLVSPLRLVSAAIWQTVQNKVVSDYGLLEEFVSTVLDIVPELLSKRHRAQLTLCLRARVIVELCRSEATADFDIIQPHLNRMDTLNATWPIEPEATTMEQLRSNFICLIKNLLENPEQRQDFFQNVFLEEFGPRFDKELKTLMWLFLSRFEQVLPLQTLQQVASMLGNVPSVLEECMETISDSEELKTLLDHQKDPRLLEHSSNCSYDGSRVFSALDLFSVEKGLIDIEMEESESENITNVESSQEAILLKEIDTSKAFYSRALRRNRDLTMKVLLLQEKRRLHGEESPACSPLSTFQPAASKSLSITGSVVPPVDEISPNSGNESPSGPEVSDDDMDPSYFPPTESYDDEESLSRSSDEEPSTIVNVDESVTCKAQNRHPKPATAKVKKTGGRCAICNEQVKANMKAHMKVHFPNDEYACPRCDTKFKNVWSFLLHMKRTCYDQQQVSQEEGLEGSSYFKCVDCEKAFRYKQSLEEHKRTHNKLYCEVCERVLRNEEALERHKVSHLQLQCTLCDENFRLYKPLARHYENVHLMSRPFKCNHCPKSFSKLSNFIRHEWKHTDQRPFQCAQCAMRFTNDADLVSHLRVHTREKPFLCAECGKTFSVRTNLKRHWDFVHGHLRNERRYSCSQCELSFKEKGSLRKHEKTKHLHQLFRFPCPVCGKLFSSSGLGRHKLIHTGEKPFKCKMPDCEKYFRSTVEVKRHMMQTHTEERPFQCDICKKGFIWQNMLRAHMHIHSGEKPFVCSICGKGFLKFYNMKRHTRLVHTFS